MTATAATRRESTAILKSSYIAIFAAAAISLHVALRYAIGAPRLSWLIPLWVTLAVGGISLVDELIHIGRRMRVIALQSALGGMALSVVGMIAALLGYLPPVAGALVQEAIDLGAEQPQPNVHLVQI
jgi:hypothetical protein